MPWDFHGSSSVPIGEEDQRVESVYIRFSRSGEDIVACFVFRASLLARHPRNPAILSLHFWRGIQLLTPRWLWWIMTCSLHSWLLIFFFSLLGVLAGEEDGYRWWKQRKKQLDEREELHTHCQHFFQGLIEMLSCSLYVRKCRLRLTSLTCFPNNRESIACISAWSYSNDEE